MLKGKTVILGVTGGIAAYKIANLASMLVKHHCDVHVLMTEHAVHFINPIAFETLTGHKCLVDTFDRNFNYNVEHVSLAKKADLMLIAPATANVIGKAAGGICDDMLTTTIMACTCKKIFAPAMNTRMYENPILQDNLEKLRRYGMEIIEPDVGFLACGDTGAGKMPGEEVLLSYIMKELAHEKDMKGLKVLVTAGPTIEALDPVRFLSNHSSGKMGYALAKRAMWRGADVTLISGKTSIEKPPFVQVIDVLSASDMFRSVKENGTEQDIIIKAAAVADYRPKHTAKEKIKKKEGDSRLELERTEDILSYLGENKKSGQFLCGFAMETENMVEHARKKLKSKKLDMIIANNIKDKGAGFGVDTNVVTIITEQGKEQLAMLSKEEAADRILDEILKMKRQKAGE